MTKTAIKFLKMSTFTHLKMQKINKQYGITTKKGNKFVIACTNIIKSVSTTRLKCIAEAYF